MKTTKTNTSVFLSPRRIGNKVLIRTVTHYYTGLIKSITPDEILLSDAAWIADTGRFATALKNGTLNEVEPFADGIVSVATGSVVDVCNWAHALPTEQK